MYARLVRFNLSQEAEAGAKEALANNVVTAIEQQDGLHSVTFFGNDTDREYGLFVLWDSEEHAESAAQVVGPKLSGALSGAVTAPPDIRLFEVFQ